MTVYVESNFVLELALQQEQAADAREILDHAARGEISLAIPSVSITEPFSTITQRLRSMDRLEKLIGTQARDFARSSLYVAEAQDLTVAQSHLKRLVQQKHKILEPVIAGILAVARVIPVDPASYDLALQLQESLRLDLEDALVLAAVVSDLRRNPSIRTGLFVNKNTRDFFRHDVVEILRRNNCEFSGDFQDGARRLSFR
ncbi:MAG: hypothetical protein QM692_17650 [Thermomicrobiales bacterium]